jgi:hypothetical protein
MWESASRAKKATLRSWQSNKWGAELPFLFIRGAGMDGLAQDGLCCQKPMALPNSQELQDLRWCPCSWHATCFLQGVRSQRAFKTHTRQQLHRSCPPFEGESKWNRSSTSRRLPPRGGRCDCDFHRRETTRTLKAPDGYAPLCRRGHFHERSPPAQGLAECVRRAALDEASA